MIANITIAILLILAAAIAAPADEKADSNRISKVLVEAKDATIVEFLVLRKTLDELIQDDIAPFKSIEASSTDWETRMLCSIVIERVEKKEAVESLVKWKPEAVDERGKEARVRTYGAMLAEKGSEIPFFLVEKLWKDNDLFICSSKAEEKAIVAYALGLLRFERARPLLESSLGHEDYHLRLAAARSLGEVKSPESVEPLLTFIIAGFQAPIVDGSHAVASESLVKCVTKDSLPLLKETLTKVEDGELNDQDNELKALLKLLIMALEK